MDGFQKCQVLLRDTHLGSCLPYGFTVHRIFWASRISQLPLALAKLSYVRNNAEKICLSHTAVLPMQAPWTDTRRRCHWHGATKAHACLCGRLSWILPRHEFAQTQVSSLPNSNGANADAQAADALLEPKVAKCLG